MISILPESNYAAVMTETVEPYLDSRRQEMDMPLSTGGTLHAEVYEQPDATRAVVILHGYTESAEKFREMTWYFLNEKFNVYADEENGRFTTTLAEGRIRAKNLVGNRQEQV